MSEGDAALAKGDAVQAESLFGTQAAANATVANLSGLATAQLEQGKLTEALATAKKATTAFPTSADAQALLGQVLTRSGEIPEALAAYKKALAMNVCSADAHFGLAKLEQLNLQYASAAKQLAMAHQLAPNDAAISAAYVEVQPVAGRAAAIRTFLGSQAAIQPATRERLVTEAEILEQHLTCVGDEVPGIEQVELLPVLNNGKSARSWGLKAKFNEAASPLLELDTSISGIVLTASDAKKAGVKPLEASAGEAPYTGYVDQVRVGKTSYKSCPVRVVPDSALANSNSVIGTDFFRDRLIHIDYVATTLTLGPLPVRPGITAGELADRYVAPEMATWSRAYVAGPAVLLPTAINDKGSALFMLDTGIVRSVISPAVVDRQLGTQGASTLPLRGSVGSIVKVVYKEGGGDRDRTDIRTDKGALLKVSTPLKLPVYHFTNNTYPDQTSISFDLSSLSQEAGTEVSGLLGFWVLRGYTLDMDYRDGLVQVVFDQNRRYERQHAEGYY